MKVKATKADFVPGAKFMSNTETIKEAGYFEVIKNEESPTGLSIVFTNYSPYSTSFQVYSINDEGFCLSVQFMNLNIMAYTRYLFNSFQPLNLIL